MKPLSPTPGPWFQFGGGTYRLIREASPSLENPGVTDIALFQAKGDATQVYMLSADGKSYLPMPLGEIKLPSE